jgi:hypothetical protein
MEMFKLSLSTVLAAAALAAILASSGPAAAIGSSTPSGFKMIVNGLDHPRGMVIGPDGALYIAEAGRGGSGPCVMLRGTPFCYGATGAVTRLRHYVTKRIASGLPSHTAPGGTDVNGPHAVAFDSAGKMLVANGLGMDPAMRSTFGSGGANFGFLMRFDAQGTGTPVVDVSAYETKANPAGGPLDSNPFGLLTDASGQVVVDAGGNDLLRVDPQGAVSTIATFPSRPARSTDSVPTSVAVGPDGAYYVGELTGFPFAPGSARIYRVVAGQPPQIFREGFTTIIGMAFAKDGTLYVLQHSSGPFMSGAGVLIKLAPDGTRTTISSELTSPTSVYVGPHGAVYVTDFGRTIGGGQVLRLIR